MDCRTPRIRLGASHSCAAPELATAQGLNGDYSESVKGITAAFALLLFDAEALESLVEARQLTAAVDEALLPACPSRVRFWIDVEPQRIPRFTVGRARLI